MKNKAVAMMVLASLYGADITSKPKATSKEWKPEFTDEELEQIRSLPKKERKKLVRELRHQHYLNRHKKAELDKFQEGESNE